MYGLPDTAEVTKPETKAQFVHFNDELKLSLGIMIDGSLYKD